MVGYDNTYFMATEYEMVYYDDLAKIKFPLERCISMENMPKKLPSFQKRLVATRWTYFSPNPCRAND